MAAIWILVINIAPSKAVLSSPIFPCERLSMRILPESIISSSEIEDLGELMTERVNWEETNCPTLLRMGEMASVRSLSVMPANSCSQKLRSTGS